MVPKYSKKKGTKTRSGLPTEHDEQVTFVRWFRWQYPNVRIFAIPNGGYRHKLTVKKLQAEGVAPGVPDLYIPAWKLWVEMKRSKGGCLSDYQKNWIGYLEGIGDRVIIAKGCQDAIRQIRN